MGTVPLRRLSWLGGSQLGGAVQALRKKGLAAADKKAGRVAAEGLLAQYIHAGSRSNPKPVACAALPS